MIRTALGKIKSRVRQTALDAMCRQLLPTPAGGRAPFGVPELKMLRAALLSQNLCCIDGQMVTPSNGSLPSIMEFLTPWHRRPAPLPSISRSAPSI